MPHFWISRSPDFQIPGFPGPQIFRRRRRRRMHVLSDPNLTPFPTHPGTKYVARALAAIMAGSMEVDGDYMLPSILHILKEADDDETSDEEDKLIC